MKVIFLDIDGVLNCQASKARCEEFVGIDTAKVRLLRKLVENTGAVIVLTSTWKKHWNKRDHFDKYMHNKFGKEHIEVFSCTDGDTYKRGAGIHDWLKEHEVESWVVLDDEIFGDYDRPIFERLVKTEWYDDNGGIHEEHIELATKILNEKFIQNNTEYTVSDEFVHAGLSDYSD